jgi:two-component system sensor histidine kinase MprB
MADQVEETITTLRRFVSDAAHELHSPLTALQTDLELSADEADPAKQRDLIQRAQVQVKRLRDLAGGLLDLSRLEAPNAQPDRSVLDLAQLVRELGEPYASQADQAGLTLQLNLPPEPIEWVGNADQLRRAIGNLIDNAIKFTPEGGTVTIDLRCDDEQIELCVSDTGIGIPDDDLPQLFSRFHRGRNAASYPGNGLGLAIVKAIVEAHGGTVRGENSGRGARFCLQFKPAVSGERRQAGSSTKS